MGRSPCCDKVGLKKGPWTPEEDHKLTSYIQQNGHGSWRALPPKAGLKRCGKSCRLRWTNYLRPDIKRGKFSLQEEQTIIQLHALLGNRWSTIASHLPNRTDNEVKNFWNTHIKKRLTKMGIDPITHKPKNHALIGSGQPKDVANLSHMAQWESTRLEAEARIVRESKFLSSNSLINKSTSVVPLLVSSLPLPPRPPCLDILKAWQATKPSKDILAAIINGGSLESPTSILNFSDNTRVTNTSPIIGLVHANSSTDKNCMENLEERTNIYQGKGIMGKSPQVHDNLVELIRSSSGDDNDSLRFPSFMEGFSDLSPLPDSSIACVVSNTSMHTQQENAACEDNNKISYWSNILNALITSDDF